jgi:hypothetical protein
MSNSTIDYRSCATEIDSENGIHSTIIVCAVFASEYSKVGKLRYDVSPAVDANCTVPHWDVLQDPTNGFIRKHRSFLRWLSMCGLPVSSRHTAQVEYALQARGHPATSPKMASRILSDYSIIQRPDCLFRRHAQCAFDDMTASFEVNDRSSIPHPAESVTQQRAQRV